MEPYDTFLVCLKYKLPSRKRQILARPRDTGADLMLPCADPEIFVDVYYIYIFYFFFWMMEERIQIPL